MPSGSGVVHSMTFTPTDAVTLIVTAAYSCVGSAGDNWGSDYTTKLYVTQDGVTTYSDALPMGNTRISQMARKVFSVAAGLPVECGIYGSISGAVAASWYDISLTAELIKR